MLAILGLIAGMCFAWCGVPSAWVALRTKTTPTPRFIALLIFSGSILMYSYLFLLDGFNPVLTWNCSIEIVSWGVISYYAVKGG